MLNPKSDLYRSEWLELVFDDRNKSYGAYDLRKHYAETLLKALGITLLSAICLFEGYNIVLQHQDHEIVHIVDLNPPIQPPPVSQTRHIIPPKIQEQHQQTHAPTIRYPRMVETVDQQAENPPTVIELQTAAISTETKKGDPGDATLNITDPGPASSGMNVVTETNVVVDMRSVEIMPAFPGGEAAWSKFLQKNLRYTQQALDAGISGKVFVSFVVEKDGHLSDITVDRGVGYGLDEETVRVLKLVPPWKPGIQNGRPVRVRYTMPFNFQLPPTD
jgi:protein TonB